MCAAAQTARWFLTPQFCIDQLEFWRVLFTFIYCGVPSLPVMSGYGSDLDVDFVGAHGPAGIPESAFVPPLCVSPWLMFCATGDSVGLLVVPKRAKHADDDASRPASATAAAGGGDDSHFHADDHSGSGSGGGRVAPHITCFICKRHGVCRVLLRWQHLHAVNDRRTLSARLP